MMHVYLEDSLLALRTVQTLMNVSLCGISSGCSQFARSSLQVSSMKKVTQNKT